MLNANARPWLGGDRAGTDSLTSAGTTRQDNSSIAQEPLALQVFKRQRWLTVGKLTLLDGEMILGIAVRHQQGTDRMISVPLVVLDFAAARGVEWLYWRRDRAPLEMRRLRIAELRRKGWLQSDGELYVSIDRMSPVTWHRWPYAQEVLRLGAEKPPQKQQLEMFAGVGR